MRLSSCKHCGKQIIRCPHADESGCGYLGWFHVLDGEHYCDLPGTYQAESQQSGPTLA